MNPEPRHLDAISELLNIGVGRAAGMLNQMVGSPIRLEVPSVKILRASQLGAELGTGAAGARPAEARPAGARPAEARPAEALSFVRLSFGGAMEGTAALVFPPDSAAKLVAALLGEAEESGGAADLDSLRIGTLSEVGNIVINGVMGSIGNILHLRLTYGLPTYLEASPDHLFDPRTAGGDPMVVVAHARFTVEDLDIRGTILLVFEVLSFDALLAAVDAVSEEPA